MLPVRLTACFLALAIPAGAAAQQGDSIVVTGRAEAEAAEEPEVVRKARGITPGVNALRHEPVALVQEPLCPGVAGLSAAGAGAIVDRIRDNARSLGIRLAGEEACEPNLVIAFVADVGRHLAGLARKSPHLFDTLRPADRRALMEAQGPVRAWNLTATFTRDNMPMGRPEGLVQPPAVTMWSAHSKIYTPTRQDIVASFVLIDRAAVRGMTLVQLADYATMRGLARTRPPERPGEPGSVLSLFEAGPDAAPAGLTAFDSAYLAALYEGPPNMPGLNKLLGIPRRMAGADGVAQGD